MLLFLSNNSNGWIQNSHECMRAQKLSSSRGLEGKEQSLQEGREAQPSRWASGLSVVSAVNRNSQTHLLHGDFNMLNTGGEDPDQ